MPSEFKSILTEMKKNRIIAFANLKGGVGKTTVCAMFASYLHENGKPVAVVDADIQQSLFRHRVREKKIEPDSKEPWQVIQLPSRKPEDVEQIMENLKSVPGYVLIDCPGNFEAPALKPIFDNATHVVVPLSYDDDSVDGTGLFVGGLQSMGVKAKIIFAPNRVKTNAGKKEELEARAKTIDILGKIGTVVPRIKEGIAVQRYSTLHDLDTYQKKAIGFSFDKILQIVDNS